MSASAGARSAAAGLQNLQSAADGSIDGDPSRRHVAAPDDFDSALGAPLYS
jgi:hypothetical protein